MCVYFTFHACSSTFGRGKLLSTRRGKTSTVFELPESFWRSRRVPEAAGGGPEASGEGLEAPGGTAGNLPERSGNLLESGRKTFQWCRKLPERSRSTFQVFRKLPVPRALRGFSSASSSRPLPGARSSASAERSSAAGRRSIAGRERVLGRKGSPVQQGARRGRIRRRRRTRAVTGLAGALQELVEEADGAVEVIGVAVPTLTWSFPWSRPQALPSRPGERARSGATRHMKRPRYEGGRRAPKQSAWQDSGPRVAYGYTRPIFDKCDRRVALLRVAAFWAERATTLRPRRDARLAAAAPGELHVKVGEPATPITSTGPPS